MRKYMNYKDCERCIHFDYCNYKENYYEFGIVCSEYEEQQGANTDGNNS